MSLYNLGVIMSIAKMRQGGMDIVVVSNHSSIIQYCGGAAVISCANVRAFLSNPATAELPEMKHLDSIVGLREAIMNRELTPYVMLLSEHLENMSPRLASLIVWHELAHVKLGHQKERMDALNGGASPEALAALADYQEMEADRFSMEKHAASPYELRCAFEALQRAIDLDPVAHMAAVAQLYPQRWAALTAY
jgi:hypothetical protein